MKYLIILAVVGTLIVNGAGNLIEKAQADMKVKTSQMD